MGLALRPNIGMWKYIRICINTLTIEELTVSDYLKFKEGLTEAGGSACALGTCKETHQCSDAARGRPAFLPLPLR